MNIFYIYIKAFAENKKNKKKDIILIDPGMRTIINGYSNDKEIRDGTNVYKTLKKEK